MNQAKKAHKVTLVLQALRVAWDQEVSQVHLDRMDVRDLEDPQAQLVLVARMVNKVPRVHKVSQA